MTEITYLDHSGFVVTLPDVIMVFDYYRDPAHALHKILEKKAELPVIFFVSHHHHDHYNTGIFEIAQNHERTYVLSNDILAEKVPSTLAVAGMSAGDILENLPGGIKVKAYKSTDEGVSFLVTTADGTAIYHAGDFNDWHWQDESTEREARVADELFKKILNRIASENEKINIAMFPVDVRQGSDFARGAKLFLKAIKVDDFFPMHFGGDYKEACDFSEYAESPETTFYCLHKPGETVELK